VEQGVTSPRKPILQVLRDLLQHRTDDAGTYEFVLESWIEEAANEIERLQSRWISVSERLPEAGETVLVWDGGERQFAWLNFTANGTAYFSSRDQTNFEPTHWMPLPNPPEAKRWRS